MNGYMQGGPMPKCRKCGGSGRNFNDLRAALGERCTHCDGTGNEPPVNLSADHKSRLNRAAPELLECLMVLLGYVKGGNMDEIIVEDWMERADNAIASATRFTTVEEFRASQKCSIEQELK